MTSTVRVWDPLVRVLHWSLATGVAAAWVTSSRWSRWHEPIGFVVLAVVAIRIVWGLVGPRHARFRSFVRGPRATLGYLGLAATGREPRHLGHNPLGGWMVAALLACVAVICLSGWLFTTDRFWGDPLVSAIHEVAAWAVLGLVACHVAGVIVTGRRHRENLVAAMVTGRKRPPADGDVD